MTANQLRISVLVACHNYGRFLDEAVDSIDAQERRPDEIIICDDGSTDETAVVMAKLVAGRDDVITLRHATARGLIRTFGEMVDRSTGELIMPLSADDRFGPGYTQTMEAAMLANDWDFAYSDYQCFGAEEWFFRAPDFDPDLLARFNFISGAAVFRRELWDRVGGYNPAFERLGFEDYDFWLSAIERGAIGGRVHGCEYEWRRHPGASRNTATLAKRVKLRLMLLRYHPRFLLHPRTLRAIAVRARAG